MNYDERRHIKIITERIQYLEKRIKEYEKKNTEKKAGFDRTEKNALEWALGTIFEYLAAEGNDKDRG